MFPVVRIRLHGLEPTAMYSVALEFEQSSTCKWKFSDGAWQPCGTADAVRASPSAASSSAAYRHPDSPNFGWHWMQADAISFHQMKMSNKQSGRGMVGQICSLLFSERKFVFFQCRFNSIRCTIIGRWCASIALRLVRVLEEMSLL